MRLLFVVAVVVTCVVSAGVTDIESLLQQNQPVRDGPGHARRSGVSPNSTSSDVAYELVDTYDATNMLEKFTFFDGDDPTHGFVLYQNSSEARSLGLVQPLNNTLKLKVDDTTKIHGNLTGQGRRSVRLESVASYAEGLVVADFSHLPQPKCGAWPAFWTLANKPSWPNGGEIDIYEQWNTYTYNRQTLHMNSSFSGNCSLAVSHDAFAPVMTNYNYTNDCNVTQPDNIGCSSWDFEGPYASRGGGVYALELSRASNFVKLWTWHHDDVPFDLVASNGTAASTPDPSLWSTPGLFSGGSDCDVARTFANQSIIMNIALCGDAVVGEEWVKSGCARETGYNSCERYVAANPDDFTDVWFGVRSVKVYQAKKS